MSHLVERVGGCQPGRTRANHRDIHPRTVCGNTRHDPSLLPRPLDDGILNAFDCDGRVDKTRHTRALAGGRAHPSRKLGEIVGLLIVEVVEEFSDLGGDIKHTMQHGEGAAG